MHAARALGRSETAPTLAGVFRAGGPRHCAVLSRKLEPKPGCVAQPPRSHLSSEQGARGVVQCFRASWSPSLVVSNSPHCYRFQHSCSLALMLDQSRLKSQCIIKYGLFLKYVFLARESCSKNTFIFMHEVNIYIYICIYICIYN